MSDELELPEVGKIVGPQGADIAANATFSFPVRRVRTFTVSNESGDDVKVDLGSGGGITMSLNGSRTWGTGDAARALDVSEVKITPSGTGVDVIWEV